MSRNRPVPVLVVAAIWSITVNSVSRPTMAGQPTGHLPFAVDCSGHVSAVGLGSQISGRQMLLGNQNMKASSWGLTARKWRNPGRCILSHRHPGLEKNPAGKMGGKIVVGKEDWPQTGD